MLSKFARLLALAAAALASVATSQPPFETPVPDSCDQGQTGSVTSLEVSDADDSRFRVLQDYDLVYPSFGGQGLGMLGVRYRVTGTNVPECASHRSSLVLCGSTGECADGTLFAEETSALKLYEQEDGSFVTEVLWLIPGYWEAGPGDLVQLNVSLAGAELTQEFWVDQEGMIQPTEEVWGETNPTALTLDDGVLYWLTQGAGGQVRARAASGGVVQSLAVDQGIPSSLAVDADRVYWASDDGGTVMSVPRSGGAVITHASGESRPAWLQVDDHELYWMSSATGEILSAPKDSSSQVVVQKVSGDLDRNALALDDGYLYWSSYAGTVARLAVTGGEPEVIAEGQGVPGELAFDAGNVYWVNHTAGTIVRWSKASQTTETVASGHSESTRLVVDGDLIYAVDPADGQILVVVADGSREVLAIDQSMPHTLAVGADRIYWTNTGSHTIMSLAKPAL